jgi:hypothetical protein
MEICSRDIPSDTLPDSRREGRRFETGRSEPWENNTLWQILGTTTKARILARQNPDTGQSKLLRPLNRGVKVRSVLKISKKMEKTK